MKGKRLLINTVFLTATSLLLRTMGLVFQVYLSRKLGAAGIGLFQLVMSVNMLAATFAISGIRFAATRLVSEELGKGHGGNVPGVVRRCLFYSVTFGLMASAAMYFSADVVASRFVGDERTALSLRVLSLSLPFLSSGAVLGGYFTGVCRIGQSAVASVSEQVCKIAVSVLLVSRVPSGDVEHMCASVTAGGVAGEVFSFFVILVLYLADRRRYSGKVRNTRGLTLRMLGIAMPLAVSAYARTALNTVQNILVPKGLRRSGATAESALAGYGMIQGMVFPVITFPAVLFSSISELIVPELTEEQVKGRDDRISATANMLLKLCFIFSAGVMGALLCFSDELGQVIYKSGEVGSFIRLLAALMPVMYMDTITDGMLRGLGEHMYSMRINIIDSLLTTVLIYFLLPRFAVYGYIFILYASEIFNFFFSMRRLSRITVINQSMRSMVCSAAAVFCAMNLTRLFSNASGGVLGAPGLALGIAVFFSLYVLLIFVFGALKREELSALGSALR
ncbi:MAG: oligosaccharide flippase family protein [Oscillospiraceae bacterium]